MTARRDDGLHDDPALAEALAGWRDRERLSNDAVRALKTRRRRTAATVAGMGLVLLLTVALPRHRPAGGGEQIAHLETARGQFRTARLPDGTTIRLNGATRIDIRYAADTRRATLLAGEAYFDVVHDAVRPFVVRAGDADIRVLGTAFDVDRTAGRVDLAVHRGAVRLAGRQDGRGTRVAAGWRSRVTDGHAVAPLRFDPMQEDWRRDWIDTDDMRLADLVTILNRRAGKPILPPPPGLADRTISGRFRLDEPAAFLNAIGPAYSFQLIEHHDVIILQQIRR